MSNSWLMFLGFFAFSWTQLNSTEQSSIKKNHQSVHLTSVHTNMTVSFYLLGVHITYAIYCLCDWYLDFKTFIISCTIKIFVCKYTSIFQMLDLNIQCITVSGYFVTNIVTVLIRMWCQYSSSIPMLFKDWLKSKIHRVAFHLFLAFIMKSGSCLWAVAAAPAPEPAPEPASMAVSMGCTILNVSVWRYSEHFPISVKRDLCVRWHECTHMD